MLKQRLRRWRGAWNRRIAGAIDWGSLRSFEPVDRYWGSKRGLPVDRWYIDEFLARHRDDMHGVVLESGHSEYSERFGKAVTRREVIHRTASNRRATIVGDLVADGTLPADTFDCVLLTQTLQYVTSPERALLNCHRALKQGGILLLSVPCISLISPDDRQESGEYWRFTSQGVGLLLAEVFGASNVQVEVRGNLVATTAFLHGLAAEELTSEELARSDPHCELLVLARAVRP